MDIHPEAAAAMSALAEGLAPGEPAPLGGGKATSGDVRRADDPHQLRARLLRMIVTNERSRKASDSPPR
jgi:hypothetical protein